MKESAYGSCARFTIGSVWTSALIRFALDAMSKRNRTGLPFEPNLLLINRVLEVISGKWRLYIILILGEQTLRYSQLAELLPDVSEKVLAGELKALVALGVMKRIVYAQIPPRVEYTLTEKGQLILPLLRQIQQIGQLLN